MTQKFIHHRRPRETLIEPVGTLAELRLIAVGDVEDRALIFCEETGHTYAYDYDSVDTDNGSTIIEPTGGTGAWNATSSPVPSGDVTHNDTAGLQGGTAGEYYHLTEDEHTVVVAGEGAGGFREKWAQETTYTTDDTGTVGAGQELFLTELDVEGEFDVEDGGSLYVGDPFDGARLWRRRWSQEQTVSAATFDVLPDDTHLVVVSELDVLGALDVQGTLYVVDVNVLLPTGRPVVVTISADETIDADRLNGTIIFVDTSSGLITVTLESAPSTDRNLTFKNIGTAGNDATIARNGNNIDGAAGDLVLPDGAAAQLIWHATADWQVL